MLASASDAYILKARFYIGNSNSTFALQILHSEYNV